MNGQIWWYAARAGGILAWLLLAASVLWGLTLTTRVAGRITRPAWLLDLHRFLGAAAVAFTGIHVLAILLDTYVHFGLAEVLVPLTGTWHPVAVAWGIVGFYLLVAIEVTSLVRSRLPRPVWRSIHFVSFPLFVVTTIHGLSAGTDRHSPLMVWGTVAICVMVAALTALRVAAATSPRPQTVAPRF
ncbi:MAG TPA: ferric reductase-like transmembrane domain-containing protein [Actinomycetota bacterium]|jgi:DMSO/TMAO reductase YedYZ heme-binding membrane subunit